MYSLDMDSSCTMGHRARYWTKMTDGGAYLPTETMSDTVDLSLRLFD